MDKTTKEWRELEAYVTDRRAELLKSLASESMTAEVTQATRIEYRMLDELLTALGTTKRPPAEPIDFGIEHE